MFFLKKSLNILVCFFIIIFENGRPGVFFFNVVWSWDIVVVLMCVDLSKCNDRILSVQASPTL